MVEKMLNIYLVGMLAWCGWNIGASSFSNDLKVGKPQGIRITRSPQSQNVGPGQPLLMYVEAHTGRRQTLRYQWYFNKIPIVGAEGPTLTLLNFQKPNVGYYSVVIKGIKESVSSPLVLVNIDQNVTSPSPRSAASTWQQAGPFDSVPGR